MEGGEKVCALAQEREELPADLASSGLRLR